ncbi:hypothetical protein [Auraticoccus monumenti]|uniref:Uncharacterized protein n=1 Tax=Auraticoccus monumenti TaxID=675864 RepID=A0A1G6SR42_9ACTN|nr:hypothetical protein [Auraticoccus monumenti]SDD19342.1 hypothetical protein SAMN04489747_0403 [Auraticoccus monumenti]
MENNRPDPRGEAARPDVEAALAARRELGPEYDEAIAAGLADRVEQLAAARSAELAVLGRSGSAADQAERSSRTQRFTLGVISLGVGVPITAISATNVEPGLLGVVVSWAGIVGVNAVFALGNLRSRRRDR